jgi:hypothetical protein
MAQLELSEHEAKTLSEALDSYLTDLRTEMVATENREWRAEMKERELLLKDIISRLAAPSMYG